MTIQKWYVHIWVHGYYSGAYEHPDRETAQTFMRDRRIIMSRFGCHYELSAKPTEPR